MTCLACNCWHRWRYAPLLSHLQVPDMAATVLACNSLLLLQEQLARLLLPLIPLLLDYCCGPVDPCLAQFGVEPQHAPFARSATS
jgi:hypothetical protein